MKTLNEIEITEEHLKLKKYNYQPKLTAKLDELNKDFDQEIINQIVLWKVNRFTEIDNKTLILINSIDQNSENIDENLTAEILENLLTTNGIQLAMASTILRFKNPTIYQIIDQRVYRIIYGETIPKYFSSIDKQISLYLKYLIDLKNVCNEKGINFALSDRIIYELDKEFNKDEKIKY